MTLARGDRIGDYVLIERLGSGSFGEVWKANHLLLPRTVALKVAKSDRAVSMLERESVAQYSLDHPGIVRVLEAHLRADPPHCVLEYVAGPSLRDLLHPRGHLEFPDVTAIFGQLVSALAYAHDHGVVHADLKPENILIERGSGGGRAAQWTVRVTDFQLGEASAVDETAEGGSNEVAVRHSLQTGEPFGTFRYMAPEQETRGEKVDARADLFSLGVVLFEMLTGSLPQGRDLPSDLRPSISWWWDHIFGRCFTGRERRYQSIHELQRDLACARTGPVWGEMPSQRQPAGPAAAARPLAARAPCEAAAGDLRPRPARRRGVAVHQRPQPPRAGFAIAALLGLALLVPTALSSAVWQASWQDVCRSAHLRPGSVVPKAWTRREVSLSSVRARDLLQRYIKLRRYRDEVPLAKSEVIGYTAQLERLRRSADSLGLSLRDAVELESGRHRLDVYRTEPVLRLRWRQGGAVQWGDGALGAAAHAGGGCWGDHLRSAEGPPHGRGQR